MEMNILMVARVNFVMDAWCIITVCGVSAFTVFGNDCTILSFLIVLVYRNDCAMGLFQLVYRVVYRNYCATFASSIAFLHPILAHRKGSVPNCNLDYLHGGGEHYYVV